MRDLALYERALEKQQLRRRAVVARRGNVMTLRDPWAVYDEQGEVLVRIPHGTPPAPPSLCNFVLDALLLLSARAPHVYRSIVASGLSAGWLQEEASGRIALAVPIRRATASTVVEVGGRAVYMSPDNAREVFQLVGGVARLVAWAKANPTEFADLCNAIFATPKKRPGERQLSRPRVQNAPR